MNLKTLDCTLRDGGYVNNWNFKNKEIVNVLRSLYDSGIEIIEVGFVNDKKGKDCDSSLFSSIDAVSELISNTFTEKQRVTRDFVVMMNFGGFDFNQLPSCSDVCVDGIRVAFHKKDRKKINTVAKVIVDKGYKFFLQPMTTSKYSDEELLELIEDHKDINIYAYYIVDSYGSMYPRELIRLFYLFEKNVPANSCIGFHSHNNFQLAFANTIELLKNFSFLNRQIIIDSSIFGMGRGAGNLNTELFLSYCNKVYNKNYSIDPLLTIIDSSLETIYRENFWGYSPAHYLSALYDTHPNYATYLVEKGRLNVSEIKAILENIVACQPAGFDINLIEAEYLQYIHKKNVGKAKLDPKKILNGSKNVLVIAPGASVLNNIDAILKLSKQNNTIIISVNHHPGFLEPDICFFGNQKRLEEFQSVINPSQLWLTSDVDTDLWDQFIDREILLKQMPQKNEDSTIILLTFLMMNKVSRVFIAGLDGFASSSFYHRYSYHDHHVAQKPEFVRKKNKDMTNSLLFLHKKITLQFITPSYYQSQLPTRVLGVIPARYHSSRFPGKPLVKINGIPMIKRTYDQVKRSTALDDIVVATDHDEIYNYCLSQNMNVILTSQENLTGTDRVAEVATQLDYDFYINIQGDEPVINDSSIDLVVNAYKSCQGQYEIFNLYKECTQSEYNSPNIIKVIMNNSNELMYMSRSDIPFSKKDKKRNLYKQVCVYGFTKKALTAFSMQKEKTKNELHEDIELLRFLDLGYSVKMVSYHYDSISVDIPTDVKKVEALLND